MESESKKTIHVGFKVRHLASQFLQKISERPHNSRRVKDYAAELAVSPKYLCRVCEAVFERRASDLIYEQIAKEAKRRLTEPNAQIKVVAEDLGFAHASHFCRFFKKNSGEGVAAFRDGLDLGKVVL